MPPWIAPRIRTCQLWYGMTCMYASYVVVRRGTNMRTYRATSRPSTLYRLVPYLPISLQADCVVPAVPPLGPEPALARQVKR